MTSINQRRFGLGAKLMLLVVAGFLPLFLVILLFLIPQIEQNLMQQKKVELKHLVESAYCVLVSYETLVQEGKLSQEEAQSAAMEQIRKMRYADNNYFWINDFQPKMIMHPNYSSEAKPEWYAENGLVNYQDMKGKKLFVAFVETCKANKEGYVDYLWTKPGQAKDKFFEKVSFVRSFEPWGWILGTGVYIDDVHAIISALLLKMNLILITVILLSLVFMFVYARTISRRIRNSMALAGAVAQGDLTGHLEDRTQDELGTLTESMNVASERLRDMIRSIDQAAGRLKGMSDDVKAIASTQADESTKQSDLIMSTNASMEEVSASVDQIAQKTLAQSDAVEKMSKSIQKILDSITLVAGLSQGVEKASRNTTEHIQDISKSYEESIKAMKNIEESARKITGFIDVINDIADQTNLLALNASIEAARAGEAGRGFAVVAKEISKLSDKSLEATKEIESLVKETDKNVEQGSQKVMAIDEKIRSINTIIASNLEASRKMAEAVNTQMAGSGEIKVGVDKLTEMAQDIASMSEEQSSAIAEMSQNMEKIHMNTNGVASSAEKLKRDADNLDLHASELKGLFGKFKI